MIQKTTSWPNSDSDQGCFELRPLGKAWNRTSFCFVSLLNILTKVSLLTSWGNVQLGIHPWPWYHITQYYQYHVTEKDCRMDQSKCMCQHRLKEVTNKSKCCVSMLRTNLDYIATSLKKKNLYNSWSGQSWLIYCWTLTWAVVMRL